MGATGGTPRVSPQAAVPVGETRVEQPDLRRPPESATDEAADRLPRGIARASDGLLEFLVLAFAAWTVIYHVCLVLHVDAVWAAVVQAVALVPCGWVAFRRQRTWPDAPPDEDRSLGSRRRIAALGVVNVLAALAAGVLFAFTSVAWEAVWLLWMAAAAAAVILTILRPGRWIVDDVREKTPSRGRRYGPSPAWPATLVVLLWAAGLGALSLFLVNVSGDDTQYVHLSSWIAAHGKFPLRDTLFSNQVFPAVIFPPLSSFEALVGTVAGGLGLAVPDLVYLVVAPLASALSVLATWRLLRSWSVRMVGVALSVAMVFLLMDAHGHRTLGSLFISRIWQGKIIFLAILIPLLFVLLKEYVEAPTGRQLLLLAAAGTASVGLSTTGVFLAPVIAAGCLAPLALRSAKRAAVGFVATAGYPLGAGAITLAVGGRHAEVYEDSDVVPGRLVHLVLGEGVFALVAVGALLVGPVLIRRATAAQMTATTVLLVGCLYTPLVPLVLFRLTGLGQVQWRWTWAAPTAALVGLLATHAAARIQPPALRVLPAALLCAGLLAWGAPVWTATAKARLAAEPAWKRPARSIEAARLILADARPGDVILAPRAISQTLLVMSGTVVTVAPRIVYTRALREVPGGRPRERLLLQAFAERGLGAAETAPDGTVESSEVVRALRVVRVDMACVNNRDPAARGLLVAREFSPAVNTERISCLRAPGRPRSTG
jgi:hypothetical protein